MSAQPISVAITGGAGFLGASVARRLLAADTITVDAVERRVDDLVILDLVEPPEDIRADPRIRTITGDLGEGLRQWGRPELIFHLAAAVSAEAEADFDLGMRVNLDATRELLEAARRLEQAPMLVFTSSLAVYGSDTDAGLPEVVDDETLPRPQSSYGTQKFIGELLVADYGRKGFLTARTVRLMTTTVRPGKPNAAASSFISGIIREPIDGRRSFCPVPVDTPIAVSSPQHTVDGIIAAAAAGQAEWGSRSAMNLPALTTTPRQMLRALDRVVGAGTSDLVELGHSEEVSAIVSAWPARFRTDRARRLGLEAPRDVEEIIELHLRTRGAR